LFDVVFRDPDFLEQLPGAFHHRLGPGNIEEGLFQVGNQLLDRCPVNPLGREASALTEADVSAADTAPNIVYRALNDSDAEAIANGEGLTAKAPSGTWTAAEHVANSGPGAGGASANSPWISTTSRLGVAQAYDSGHGVVAIDLNKVPSFQTQVWQSAPRVNGIQGLAFRRSFWAQETTIFQTIPANAIIGFVK
jgi:hypothetical protein